MTFRASVIKRWSRRGFLAALGIAGVGAACTGGWWLRHGEGFRNPCLTGPMPKWLADHELVRTAWEGVRPAEVWDCHVHLAGTGDSGSGAWINSDMRTLERPFEFAHTAFFMDGACILLGASEVDEPYGRRLVQLIDAFPAGVRLLLMAFEAAYAESGQMLLSRTAFFVPNEYVRGFARRFPERFEWIASVHPYRSDAIEALEEAALWGARAIKWLPSLMNIDPDSPRCDAFYEALRRVDLPLLTHGGYEHPILGSQHELNGPLKLRRALDHGVRVIVAHCATEGESPDPEASGVPVANFRLFARMMDESRYEGLLFGDISAITSFRDPNILRELIERIEWHPRLLYGSDYPLPGIAPAVSPNHLAEQGFLQPSKTQILRELRRYNPLLFDYTLKRHLRANGKGFAADLFETRRFFEHRRAVGSGDINPFKTGVDLVSGEGRGVE